jgi:hypothetical protein
MFLYNIVFNGDHKLPNNQNIEKEYLAFVNTLNKNSNKCIEETELYKDVFIFNDLCYEGKRNLENNSKCTGTTCKASFPGLRILASRVRQKKMHAKL